MCSSFFRLPGITCQIAFRPRIIAAVVFLQIALYLAFNAQAQTSLVVSGNVADNSGASISNARVLLICGKTAGNVATTDAAGHYAIALESAGRCIVQVEKLGFKTYTASSIVPAGKSIVFDVVLDVQGRSDTVEVIASSAADTATVGLLGSGAIKDLSYAVYAVSADSMKNAVASNLQEALRYNPTVNVDSGTNYLAASVEIRGFQAGTGTGSASNIAIDGLRSYARTDPTEDKERLEILNGSNSFLYGISSPAGMINYVSKQPPNVPLRSMTAGSYGGKQVYVLGDFGGPLPRHLGYRVNLDYVGNGQTPVHDQTHERYTASGMLNWDFSARGRLSFIYEHYQRWIYHGDDMFSLASAVTRIPSVPDAAANYLSSYSSAIDFFTRTGSDLTLNAGHGWTVHTGYRYTPTDSFRHRAADTITNNKGDFTQAYTMYLSGDTSHQGYAFVEKPLQAMHLHHDFKIGYTVDRSETRYSYPYTTVKTSVAGTHNLYAVQNSYIDTPNIVRGAPERTTDLTTLTTLIAGDQMRMGKAGVFAGITRAKIDELDWDYTNFASKGTFTKQPENHTRRITPGITASYDLRASVTGYASYMEGLQVGTTVASSYANANQVLAPYMSRQYEAGVKSRLANFSSTLALFQIATAAAYVNPVSNIYSEDGREVHRGVEFTSNARIRKALVLNGGFTLLNPEITRTSTASAMNKAPIGVPKQIARLASEYQLPRIPRLILTGGYSYSSQMWLNSSNTLVIPGVSTGDAGARYEARLRGLGPLLLRMNIVNLTNKNYWTSSGSSLNFGQPRTFACSAEYRF